MSQVEPRPTVVVSRSVPGRLLRGFGQTGSHPLELLHHVVDGAEEVLALLGEDQAAGVAVEERHAEVLLERRRPAGSPPTGSC